MVFTKKSNSRRPRKSYRKRPNFTKSVAKAIKTIALRNSEMKHLTTQTENINIYHNVAYGVAYNMLLTNQGSSQIQRIGDEVTAKYLHIKMWISQKLDRPNVMYRIILMAANSGQSLAWSAGSSGNYMIANIDTDKVKVIRHKLIQPRNGDFSVESGATNREHSQLVKFKIDLKDRKIKYTTDGGTTPKLDSNYYSLYIIPYDAYGTPTSDNIASFACQSTFYYKDP